MRKTYPGVVVHCSDSTFGNAQTIEDWHKQRGWSDIGYHFTILNGQIENNTYLKFMDGMVEAGRDLDNAGAHAVGYNNYIGICLIGIDKFTENQFKRLAEVIYNLMKEFNFTIEDILFHYEVSSKTCPNFNKEWFIDTYMINKE